MDRLGIIDAALQCDWPAGPMFGEPAEKGNKSFAPASGLILLRLNDPPRSDETVASNGADDPASVADHDP
jgi:hypothetical protein